MRDRFVSRSASLYLLPLAKCDSFLAQQPPSKPHQMTPAMETKGVWLKFRANLFYPPWVHAVSVWLVALPAQV